jgi:hypothetical protein
MNEMVGLRTEVASLWDELDHRGPKGKRHVRWTISPPEEFIAKNINEKARILSMIMMLGLDNIKTIREFSHKDISTIE